MEPFRLLEDRVLLLDQTRLPAREVWLPIDDAAAMTEAIASLRVRGAPAIGIAAALGLWLEAERAEGSPQARVARLEEAARRLEATRPTASNLARAVRRMLPMIRGGRRTGDAGTWRASLRAQALALWEEDREASRGLARHGATLFPEGGRFLTHCHTGGLATGGGGTALGVLLELHRRGRPVEVWATETRPLLQGARLTAWELLREDVPVTLLADGAAAALLARGRIDAVIVGADRIARNGDVANKVGTYALALAARESRVPFVVAAPTSTVDPSAASGAAIPIEERDPSEVLALQGIEIAPRGVLAFNPAFDVTPAELVTHIITERGIASGPRYSFEPVDFPEVAG